MLHFTAFYQFIFCYNSFSNMGGYTQLKQLVGFRRIFLQRPGTSIFLRSLRYVYFDQYLRIIGITKELLGLGLAAVLLGS